MTLILNRRALPMVSRVPATVLVALSLVLAACGKDKPTDAATPGDAAASLAVSLAPAAMQRIERTVIASGPVSAWEEMQLGVEISGVRVTALNVDVGQSVKKGQVLLELDHRTLDSELRQSQAAAAEADAGVALAQANLNRGQALVKDRLISASAFDELRAGLVQAQARQATARAQRDGVQLRRDFASLRAPDDGIISKRLVQPGQVVVAGSELLRLIRQGRLEWRAELAEADLARVQNGATVLISGAGGAVEGRVRAVSPGVDATARTGTIYVDLPDPGALKAGTFVEGRIVTGTAQALMVPAAAIVQRDGYSYVFTVGGDQHARRVRVATGASSQGRVEIVSGLSAGTPVVVAGAGFLGDGDAVRVVPLAATAAGADARP
jgi:RND family efflux transporter MFP subunit